MPFAFCDVCNRNTFRFASVIGQPCTDHSDIDRPRVSPLVGKIVIPAYSPSKDVKPIQSRHNRPVSKVRPGLTFNNDALISELLGIPENPKPIKGDKLACTFCGELVSPDRATIGVVKPRKLLKLKVTEDSFEDEVIHVAEIATACPACSLNIKPLFARCRYCKGKSEDEIRNCTFCKGTKEGERMTNGAKFPDTEG